MTRFRPLTKLAIASFLLLMGLSGYAQFDMNRYSQRMNNVFFNNPSQSGVYRNKKFGYAHSVFEGDHNISAWGTMAFGKYMHASLSDQEKNYHGVGLVVNSSPYLGKTYNNAHLTYAYHMVIGKKGSYKKLLWSVAATGNLINTDGELNQSIGASTSLKYRRYEAGVSVLNINEPVSEDVIGGFGTLSRITDLYLEAFSFKLMKRVYVHPVFFGRFQPGRSFRLNTQAAISIPKVRLYVGFGPDKERLLGLGFTVKRKVSVGYYYNSSDFGKTHEWRIQYGVSRWAKENDRWD